MNAAAGSAGVVGLGNMGLPIAERLRAAGWTVLAHDRDAEAGRRAEAAGVVVVPTLAALAASDFVVTVLPHTAVVHHVLLDDRGLLGLSPGSVVVDMGSSEPAATRQLGRELAGRGVGLVDAPVSGGVAGARAGSLTVMVGGSPGDIDRCEPLLAAVSSQIVRTGPLGSGHALKALNNLLSAVGLLAATEALLIGARFGLDPGIMLDAINQSSGRNNSTERKIAPFVLSRSFDAGFSLPLMVKDIGHAVAMARSLGVPARLAECCAATWQEAASDLAGSADHTEIVRWLERQAGLELGRPQ